MYSATQRLFSWMIRASSAFGFLFFFELHPHDKMLIQLDQHHSLRVRLPTMSDAKDIFREMDRDGTGYEF
jgi:hypothetical protein